LRYSTVAEDYEVPSFSSQTIQEDCLGLEVEVTTIVQNIGSCLPVDVLLVTRRLKSCLQQTVTGQQMA
jgi:hypothetical protein